MREPLTEELLNELLSSPDPNSFLLSANPSRRSLSEYLQQLLDEKGLERSKVVREAGLNDTFGYQIFKGDTEGFSRQSAAAGFCHATRPSGD